MTVEAQPQDYARAIYDLALEAWTRQLEHVNNALAGDAPLRARVLDAATPLRDRLDVLDLATPGRLSAGVRRFLGTLIEAGQVDQLERILAELDVLVHRRPERRLAQVTSAVPLTDSEREALRARLAERFGPDLDLQFEVDAKLLGGIHLRVGDQVIDGSIAGKLSALRDRLTAA